MHEERVLLIAALLSLQISYSATAPGPCSPDQIHLSLGDCPQDMVVTWLTFTKTPMSYVWYGLLTEGLTMRVDAYVTSFQDEGSSVVRHVHRAVLRHLRPNCVYVYRCGSAYGVSDAHVFKMNPGGTDWSPRLIVYGDMGWEGGFSFPYIQRTAANFSVDAVVHVGDIAYNMESYDGYIGDQFLRMVEPVAASVPYMTTVGNHEQYCNFSHYKNRFTMPGDSNGVYYSFDMGPAHFVAISTEVYFFPHYGLEPIINQYNWLSQDLQTAASPEKRKERPWIILLGHRPLYCSSDTGEDCSLDTNILKCSVINNCDYGLEYLIQQNKVDLAFWGHMHYYERSWPLYNNQVFNGSCNEPYKNPGACVHIITGAAGMKCGTETASYVRKDFFPFFSDEYSFTVLTVHNETHLQLEQVSASRCGEVIDSIWIIKTCT